MNKNKLLIQKEDNDKRLDKCEKLLFELDSLISQNKSSINVGILDIIAGGFLVSLHKKSKINKVKELLNSLKYLLKEYIESADENSLLLVNEKIKFSISGLLMDMDVWFDNIFSDVMVNKKLEKLMNELIILKSAVNNELMRLKNLDLYYKENLI